MRRIGISYVPLVLGLVGIIAMVALVNDRNARTWAIVMGFTTTSAVVYAAFQEQRAARAVAFARRRVGGAPYDELRREMDRARRHERPFALARVPLPRRHRRSGTSASTIDELWSDGSPPSWRSTDRFWRDGRNLYILLPETRSEDVGRTLQRKLEGRTDIEPERWRMVSYPEDGLTVGALFAALGASVPAAGGRVRLTPSRRAGGWLQGAPVPQRRDES